MECATCLVKLQYEVKCVIHRLPLHALSTLPSTMVTKEKSIVGVTLISPRRRNSCSRGDGISACTILAMLPGASLHSHTSRMYSPSCASERLENRSASRSTVTGTIAVVMLLFLCYNKLWTITIHNDTPIAYRTLLLLDFHLYLYEMSKLIITYCRCLP